MIGATITCSRSRQPAARKRDTVSAPPSISMRRKPRSASAARMAAGAICPSAIGQRAQLRPPEGGAHRVPSCRHQQAADAVVGEHLGARRQPAVRIDHDARRMRPGDPPHRQLRIVGERGADADHDGIDQRAQPVQMSETRRSVDVFRMAGGGGDAPVERLADLADHDQVVGRPGPQRPEQLAPGLRQRGSRPSENLRKFGPGIRRSVPSASVWAWPMRPSGLCLSAWLIDTFQGHVTSLRWR